MSENPLVSIIIPAFNQGHYLGAAIRSALGQTYPHFEIIVVDDGSTDDTPMVVQSFADPRVKYHRQENRGLSGARNTGIRCSHGQLLTFLDSDDCFLPAKLTLLTSIMTSFPEIGFCAGGANLIDEHGNPIHRRFESSILSQPQDLLLGNPFSVDSVLVKRGWQEKIGFFDESLRSYEDWDFWLRLALAGCPMRVIEQPVSLYRFHPAQMSRLGSQMTTATLAVLEKTFARPDLPTEWQRLKEAAFASAHLRAAAHGFLAQDYAEAHQNLRRALHFDPGLSKNGAAALASRIAAWSELPKTNDPVSFIENIYDHLPDEFQALKKHKKIAISQAAVRSAFQTYQAGNYRDARSAACKAVYYRPYWLLNRGVLSILIKSLFQG